MDEEILQQIQGNRQRIVLPTEELQQFVLGEYHVNCGHGGFNKTLAAVSSHYIWLGIAADVKRYVRSCHVCATQKNSIQKPQGLLQPLPPPSAKMQQVSMDFITDLPRSHHFDATLTITDLLTKYVFLMACRKDDSASQIARRAMHWPFGVFGLPKAIISDRDAKFTSKFWRALLKALGTELRFSTAYHPQTDGQSECTNQTVETTLRCLLADKGFAWHKHLSTAQAQINNYVSGATGHTPAMLMFGFQPRTPIELVTDPTLVDEPDANNMLRDMHAQAQAVQDRLQFSKDVMKEHADKKRRTASFSEGDMVFLNTRHIRMGGSRKLKPRFIGPFKVLEVLPSGNACRLELPDVYEKLHDVFNVAAEESSC